METKWTEAIHKTPPPEPATLTERALAQAPQSARRGLHPAAYGSLALAATLPVAFLLLPKPKQEQKPKMESVRQLTTALAFQKQAPLMLNTAPTQEKPVMMQEKPVMMQEKFLEFVSGSITEEINQTEQSLALKPQTARSTTMLSDLSDHTFGLELGLSRLSARSASATTLTQILKPQDVKMLQESKLGVAENFAAGVAEDRGLPALALGMEKPILRFPLDPLPRAPQPEGAGGSLEVHADSFQLLGKVLLHPDQRERELLIALFDSKGALVSTTRELVPACPTDPKFQEVKLRSVVVPRGTRYYQLGLRLHPSPVEREILGGYVVTGGKTGLTVPAPEGVTIVAEDFYRSNAYSDHFARFQTTLSEKLLSRRGEVSLALHGAIFDEKGALLSVASEAMKNTPQKQRLDLAFGLLPESGQHHHKFVVTYAPHKAPETSFTVASTQLEADGSLVLLPAPCLSPLEEILKKPELRDYTQIKLAPSVAAALKATGITEFVGKLVQASGKSESNTYLAFPAFEVTTITVEKTDDIQFVELPKGK